MNLQVSFNFHISIIKLQQTHGHFVLSVAFPHQQSQLYCFEANPRYIISERPVVN